MRQQGTPARPRAAAAWMGCLSPAAGGSIVSVCVCSCAYVCVRVCACAYWEYTLSLSAGWTWGHAAAAASPLSGCQISTTKTLALPEVCLKSPCSQWREVNFALAYSQFVFRGSSCLDHEHQYLTQGTPNHPARSGTHLLSHC